MSTTRSYHDVCGIARALDVIGERWALLIVRELLLGPQRFSELRQALTNTSANVISDRLRELEARGVIQRRKLAPPAASSVYELTLWGRQLEPILVRLGEWGIQAPTPAPPNVLSPTSALIYLRSCARPDPSAAPSAVRINLDNQTWTARTDHGELMITADHTEDVDAEVRTDPWTFNAPIGNATALQAAIGGTTVTISGDSDAAKRLLLEVDDRGDKHAPVTS
jgi:DNA-binding HxlR family transcriptional regulator